MGGTLAGHIADKSLLGVVVGFTTETNAANNREVEEGRKHAAHLIVVLIATLLALSEEAAQVVFDTNSARGTLIGGGLVTATHVNVEDLFSSGFTVTLSPAQRALAGGNLSITDDAGVSLGTTCVGGAVTRSAISNCLYVSGRLWHNSPMN